MSSILAHVGSPWWNALFLKQKHHFVILRSGDDGFCRLNAACTFCRLREKFFGSSFTHKTSTVLTMLGCFITSCLCYTLGMFRLSKLRSILVHWVCFYTARRLRAGPIFVVQLRKTVPINFFQELQHRSRTLMQSHSQILKKIAPREPRFYILGDPPPLENYSIRSLPVTLWSV